MNKNEIPTELKNKLNEFHVEVPNIPMKRSRLNRLVNWIFEKAVDPLEALSINQNSFVRIIFFPVIIAVPIILIPLFFI